MTDCFKCNELICHIVNFDDFKEECAFHIHNQCSHNALEAET